MTRLLAVVLLGTVTVVAAAQNGDLIVAEMAGTRITLAQFQQWLDGARRQGGYLQAVGTLTPEGQERVLQTLVDQRLFAAAARDAGLDRDASTQFAIEQRIAELLAEQYREHVLGRPSDADLRTYYTANADAFRTGARVKARHILLKTRDDAQAALDEVRGGADFGDVARRRSADPASARNGGDLGWVSRGLMVRPFDDALFSLASGQTSAIVQTSFGFHIIRADEVDRGGLAPFEAIREQVVERMTAERVAEERSRLSTRYGLTIRRDLLQAGAR